MPIDYTLKDDDPANSQTFNKVFGDINTRLKSLEKAESAINQASEELVKVGLAKINPAVEEALSVLENVSELSNLFEARSESDVEISTGLTEFIVHPDDRPHFVGSKYLLVYVDGHLDKWMSGQAHSWNKETGQLFVDVTNLKGEGTFSDWKVTPVSILPGGGPAPDAYTKNEVDAAIAQAKTDAKAETKTELLGGVGEAFDTLKELADARGENVDAITALTSQIGQKADLSTLEGNTLPLGSVIFLCVDVCPPGFLPAKGQSFDPLVYPEFYAAYGKTTMPNIANRVIRGDGILAGNVDDYQEDAMQRITGSLGNTGHHINNVFSNSSGALKLTEGAYTHYIVRKGGTSTDTIGVEFDSGDSPNARVSDDETRVKSWIGYPIVKVSSAYVNQGTTDLAALENAINSAVRNDIPQTFADGGAQVRENIGALSAADIGFGTYFESALQSYTNGAPVTVAHGLGVKPSRVELVYVCISDDTTFTVGDEIHKNEMYIRHGSASHQEYGLTVYADDTSITANVGDNGIMTIETDGSDYLLNSSKWNLVLKAWS